MKSIILPFAILLMAVSTFSQTPANKQIVSPSEALYPPMIFVKGGVFQMGSDSGIADEKPRHSVTINSYSIGKYEVSQDLWQQIMGSNPSGFKGCGPCPVEQVTWKDIQRFLKILNKKTGNRYRLPTEAEWEYAAEGGENSKGYKFSGSNDPAEVGWIKSNAENKTHPCGEKKPNELGIYDMCGNVWEICSDWYSKGYYKKSPAINPVNNNAGLFRVVRGGSWRSGPERCYNTARNRNIRDHHIQNGGFRLALDK
jgi:formylglycine-generating enzyme required for sulfatase activity